MPPPGVGRARERSRCLRIRTRLRLPAHRKLYRSGRHLVARRIFCRRAASPDQGAHTAPRDSGGNTLCTTAKLVGVLAALALALAVPAALATPVGHGHRKPSHAAARHTAKASSPNIGTCSLEPDYVYAGPQCDPTQAASGSDADARADRVGVRTTITVSPTDVTAWNCSLEYEYVYAGAQCAHATSSGAAGTVTSG